MLRTSQVITLLLSFAVFSNHAVLSGTKETNDPLATSQVKKTTFWDDLDLEYLGKQIIYYSFDSKPKLIIFGD